MKILKDFQFFYLYDEDKFIKIAYHDFIFGKKLMKKHMLAFDDE
jgi:hypothetical protein